MKHKKNLAEMVVEVYAALSISDDHFNRHHNFQRRITITSPERSVTPPIKEDKKEQ